MRLLLVIVGSFFICACGSLTLAPGSRFTETTSWCVPPSWPMPRIPRVGDTVSAVVKPRGGTHEAHGSVHFHQHTDAYGQSYRHNQACRYDRTEYVY
jgi:hypothetical protein